MIILVIVLGNQADLPILEDKKNIQKRNQIKMDNKIDFLWIMKKIKNIIIIVKTSNFKVLLLIR